MNFNFFFIVFKILSANNISSTTTTYVKRMYLKLIKIYDYRKLDVKKRELNFEI